MQEQVSGPSQEQIQTQVIPLKVYRSDNRLMITAPMPGLEPQDISVEVTADGYLVLHGELRGALKGDKELLLDEWNVGGYHRNLVLQNPVDGPRANVTYGNGVLVVALPISDETQPATLTLETIAPAIGMYAGNTGQNLEPTTTAEKADQMAPDATGSASAAGDDAASEASSALHG